PVAAVYRQRWQIELLFKALKQNLKIKTTRLKAHHLSEKTTWPRAQSGLLEPDGTARHQLSLSRWAISNSKRGNQHRKSFDFNSAPAGFQLIWTPVTADRTGADGNAEDDQFAWEREENRELSEQDQQLLAEISANPPGRLCFPPSAEVSRYRAGRLDSPLTETEDQIGTLRDALFAPPQERRGLSIEHNRSVDRAGWDGVDAGLLVTIQIESPAGIERVATLARQPGIDAVMLGPYDLSLNLGLTGQLGHPDLVQAIDPVRDDAPLRARPRRSARSHPRPVLSRPPVSPTLPRRD
ncbi:MAG: aldolase/citrate lyase family protein, partial [Acidobacteria bacterium]|nr:aldolase/citrate lyase family protein [Acidobacteriota bacterium]